MNLTKIKKVISEWEEKTGEKITPADLKKYLHSEVIDAYFKKVDDTEHGIDLGEDYANIETKFDDEEVTVPVGNSADILHAPVTDAELAAVKAMTHNTRKELKIKINQIDLRTVYPPDGQRRGFTCPICGNGSGHNGDGVVIKRKDDGDDWYFIHNCYKQRDFQGTLFSVIAKENNLHYSRDFFKILAIGQRFIDAAQSSDVQDLPFISYKKEYPPEQIAMRKADIIAAQKNIVNLPTADNRNLTLQTLQELGFGYIENWIYSGRRLDNQWTALTTPRLIAPCSDCEYNSILLKSARDKFHWLDKSMNEGAKGIFHFDGITADAVNIIVEGEIDCASIYQAGYHNVAAMGGKGGYKKLIQRLNEKFPNKTDRLQIPFLVLLDNDNGGNEQDKADSQKVADALINEGYPATYAFLSDAATKVDANDVLCNEGVDALKSKIEQKAGNARDELLQLQTQLEKEIEFVDKISDWRECYGEIDSAVIKELKTGIEYLEGFNAKDLTVEIVRNSKTIKYLAACYEYNFSDIAEKFIGKAIMAKLPNISRCKIEDEVSRIRTQIRKAQKRFSDAQKEKAYYEKIRQAGIASQAFKDAQRKSYTELMKLPPSIERDEEIYSILRNVCDWKCDIHTHTKEYIKGTDKNLHIIFEGDPNLKGLIGYNEFADNFFLLKKPSWVGSYANSEWTDADDANLRIYLRRHYGEFSNNKLVEDYIISYGRQNAFHPVKKYLESLKWDGQSRAESFFIKFLGVEDTAYSRAITRNWLLGAVSRIYYPGCNFQNALVLRGNQEIGKGTFALHSSTDDPHAVDDIQVGWIIEMEEFSAGRKSEINALKSFISRQCDTRRAAYERHAKQTPRHCVFCITVNDENFLRDQTGNRRYRILECKNTKEDFQRLSDELTDEYIGQVWAEVMTIFKAEFSTSFDEKKLELPPEIKTQADEVAEIYTFNDGMQDEISAFLDKKILPEFIWDVLTKEERRKFFVDANIKLDTTEINFRWRANFPKAAQSQINRLDNYIRYNSESMRKITIGEQTLYCFYGSVYRLHVCAAEIFIECFGIDSRKNNVRRIYEVLAKMGNWEKGTSRLQGRDIAYKDQKSFYVRKENPNPPPGQMEQFMNELAGVDE